MCFGHKDPSNQSSGTTPLQPELGMAGNALYGRIDDFQRVPTRFGTTQSLLLDWSANRVDCRLHRLNIGGTLKACPSPGRETILIIERGNGHLHNGSSDEQIGRLDALRAGPEAVAEITAQTEVQLLEVSMATSATPKARRNLIELRRRNDTDWKLYEYEALGQEVFTPDYEGAIGLLRFIFPQDEIPMHVHPASGRIIRPISGRGYTYIHPDRCPMDEHTIAAFDANVIHTNGPLKGENYELWALQLPWVPSGIDTQNIAGFESFVRYVADVPRPALHKSLGGLLEMAKRQSQ